MPTFNCDHLGLHHRPEEHPYSINASSPEEAARKYALAYPCDHIDWNQLFPRGSIMLDVTVSPASGADASPETLRFEVGVPRIRYSK